MTVKKDADFPRFFVIFFLINNKERWDLWSTGNLRFKGLFSDFRYKYIYFKNCAKTRENLPISREFFICNSQILNKCPLIVDLSDNSDDLSHIKHSIKVYNR